MTLFLVVPAMVPSHVYAAGHDVESEQEHDEGNVVADDDLGKLLGRDLDPVGEDERHEKQ